MITALSYVMASSGDDWGRSSTPSPSSSNPSGNSNEPSNHKPPNPNDYSGKNSPNKKPNGDNGPPDLDQIWQDLNEKISALLGKKGGNNGNLNDGKKGKPNPPDLHKFTLAAVFALVVIILLWVASGFYMVEAANRAVILRFGKFSGVTEAGLHWRLPYPIESHEVVNFSRVRTIEVGYRGKRDELRESLMLTDDENIVNIQFAVQYTLKDPSDYLFKNRSPEDSVLQIAETAVREIVGKNKMDFVLYEGRDQVAAQAQKLMQEILDRYESGIIISKVTMQNAQPPEQVQAAFDDAVKAGQDRERQKNEGQAYANDVIPRAKGTAARLMQEAEGYKQRLIATAEGDGMRFSLLNAEYSKAPQVTRERLYIETMENFYGNVSKVMVDAKGQGNLLYLPLDKLLQAQNMQNQAAANVTNGGQVNEVPRQDQARMYNGEITPQLEAPPAVEKGRGISSSSKGVVSSRELGSREREVRP